MELNVWTGDTHLYSKAKVSKGHRLGLRHREGQKTISVGEMATHALSLIKVISALM